MQDKLLKKPPRKKSHRSQAGLDLNGLIREEEKANNQSLIHGLKRNGEYIEYESSTLKQDLEHLGYYLRLKPFQISGQKEISGKEKIQKNIEIFLSLFSEIHCLKNNDLIKNDIKHEMDGETFEAKRKRLKILDSKQKKSDKSDIQEHKKFYLMKTATIFPLEIDIDSTKQQIDLYKNRLRPEFLCMIGTFLSNGSFLNQNSQSTDQDDILLAQAGQSLKKDAVNNLLRDLENMVIQPIGSEQLSRYFHLYGVNMRHLGKVASRTDLPHIKEICLTDMIARSSKKILRAHLAKFILYNYKTLEQYDENNCFEQLNRIIKGEDTEKNQNQGKEEEEDDDDDQEYITKKQSEQQQSKQNEEKRKNSEIYEEYKEFQEEFQYPIENLKSQISENFQKVLIEVIIDYLNLIFTNDNESITFWHEILAPQIEQDFNYSIAEKQEVEKKEMIKLFAACYIISLENIIQTRRYQIIYLYFSL